MKKIQLINYLKKSALTGFGKTVIVSFSTLIFIPLIIKNIGMEKYGLITLTLLFGGASILIDLGISKSVTMLVGKENHNTNIIISSAVFILILMILLLSFIITIIVWQDIAIFGSKFNISENLKNSILIVGFIVLIFTLINNIFNAIMEVKYLVHYMNIGYAISSISLYGYIYIATFFTNKIDILIYIPLLSMLTLSLYNIFIIKKYTNIRLCIPNMFFIKKIFLNALKFLNIGLINSMIIPVNKYLLLSVTGNSAYLGIFDLSLKIAMMANNLLNIISAPLFGIFSNFKSNDIKRVFHIAKKISFLIFIGYIIGNSVFYYFGINITQLLDSQNYKTLYDISVILLFGISSTAISEPFYKALLGMNRLKEAFYLKLLIPICNITIYLLLQKFTTNELEKFSISMSISFFISSVIIVSYHLYKYQIYKRRNNLL